MSRSPTRSKVKQIDIEIKGSEAKMDTLNTKEFEIRKSKKKILGYRFTSVYLRNAFTSQQVAKNVYSDYALKADGIYAQERVYDPEFIHYVNYALNKPISIQESIEFLENGTFFQTGMLPNRIRFASKPNQWSILPIICATVRRERHAIMLLRRNGRTFCFDPNGNERNCEGVKLCFRTLYRALGEHVDLTDIQSPQSPWLLNINFQTEAIRFIDTKGFCGAFVVAVATFIVLNSTATHAQISAYFLTRQKQWRTEVSAVKTLQSILRLPTNMLKATTVYEPMKTEPFRKNPHSAFIPANLSRHISQNCKQLQTNKFFERKYPLAWVLCPTNYKNSQTMAKMQLDHYVKLPYEARNLLLERGVAVSFLETYVLLHLAYFRALKKSSGFLFYISRARGWKRQIQRGLGAIFKPSSY